MGLNPNFTEENDWEVISTGSAGSDEGSDGGSEQDLIVDDCYNTNGEEEEELRRQLLPLVAKASTPPSQAMGEGNEEETNALLPESLTTETADDVGSHLAETVLVSHENTTSSADDETEPPAGDEKTDDCFSQDSKPQDVPKQQGETSGDANSANGSTAPPPQSEPRGRQAFVASLGASVKHLGDAIGNEGQKIGQVIGKEGQKIGSSIQKESQKLGKAIEHETKRIGQVTQRVFQNKPKSRSPSPSDHARRPNSEHTSSQSPPRNRNHNRSNTTRTKVMEEQPTSLLANVLTGAAVLAGGILLARGNKGAGAALLATGGATYMANEAAKESYGQQNRNLNEELGMHMN
ncbi:MAG: hypothetical protein SGBAC_007796 [Bacillariaceae sp.]